MSGETKQEKQPKDLVTPTATVSGPGDLLGELVYDCEKAQTAFAVWREGSWSEERELAVGAQRFVPFSARSNLIRYGTLLLPSQPEEYGDEETLIAEVRAYIHRYVDVASEFEQLACYYVLLSWLYDAFNELPYLRLLGDYGSGKTRCLLVLGAVCYRPFFASGASTYASGNGRLAGR